MSRVILKAKVHNWGLIGPGDLENTEWLVRNDASYSRKATFRQLEDTEVPEQIEQGVLDSEDYSRLIQLAGGLWNDEITIADDGEAWEFRAYNSAGKLEKHRKLGYIYGIEPYESIARILVKYK